MHRFPHPAQAGDLLGGQPLAPVGFVFAQMPSCRNAAVQRKVGGVESLRLEEEGVQRFSQPRAIEPARIAAREAPQRGAGGIVGLCEVVLQRLAPRDGLAWPKRLTCVH